LWALGIPAQTKSSVLNAVKPSGRNGFLLPPKTAAAKKGGFVIFLSKVRWLRILDMGSVLVSQG
jgi:hypothetical protein